MNEDKVGLEFFCGTGGVGKTTLATSRAFFLSKKGNKTLLLTIDPSKRLRDFLELPEARYGTIHNIQNNKFLWGMIYSPSLTLENALKSKNINLKGQRILQILSTPFGGLNEILAFVEIHKQWKSGKYDKIIIDTPPGLHFFNFLDTSKKISLFFEKKIGIIFNSIYKNLIGKQKKSSFFSFTHFLSKGAHKFLHYLEKFTGQVFILEFVETVKTIFELRDTFIEALSLEEILKNKNLTSYFFVTSNEQHKVKEILEQRKKLRKMTGQSGIICMNRCTHRYWTDVDSHPKNIQNLDYKKLRNFFMTRELELIQEMEKIFQSIHTFTELITPDIKEQMNKLTTQWSDNTDKEMEEIK